LCVFKIFYVKYFRKDIIKVQVVGSPYIHRLFARKNENKKKIHNFSGFRILVGEMLFKIFLAFVIV